jgi:predicted DNA-binding transcriptional regulator AlpA
MAEEITSLKNTIWLAQRLGLSVTTIERLRAKGSEDIPPHIKIGNSIRYDENSVDQFVAVKLSANTLQVQS